MSSICIYQFCLSFHQPRYYVRGYEEAAKYILDNPKGTTTMVSCLHDGNFIFNTRKYDPLRTAIILRAEKILMSMSAFKQWGYRSYVNNNNDIYYLLNRYGTKYIVVEDQELIGAQPLQLLRNVLKSDQFSLVKTIKLESNMSRFSNLSLLIYEYLEENKNTDDHLVIKFPLMEREINLPFKSLIEN